MTPDQPQGKKRSLLGFYIATGVVAVLLVAGWLARTPIQVRYYRWKAVYSPDTGRRRVDAGMALADMGPPAEGALRELLRSKDPDVRMNTVISIGNSGRSTYWLPLLVGASQDPDDSVAWVAIQNVIQRSNSQWFDNPFDPSDLETIGAHRKAVLDWWESKGRRQYQKLLDEELI